MPLPKSVRAALWVALSAASLAAVTIPRPAREFAINTYSAKQLLLSEHRGKVVALMFILTTCPHCQQVTRELSKLQNEYGPKGFQVLSAAIEDNAANVLPGFIRRFRPAFPVGWANSLSAREYLQQPATARIIMPQLVLIDRGGAIRAQYSGDDPFFGAAVEKNLRGAIEGLLKAGARAPGRAK